MKVACIVTAAACLCVSLGVAHAAQTAGFQLKDLRRLTRLSGPQVAPDGTRVVVVMSTPVWKTDKRNTRLVLVDVATGHQRTLTWHREGVSSPRWSPDGSRLAFLAKDAKTKHTQVFVMPMNGGDARCITDAKEGVDTFSWSPDGTRIAYIAQDAPLNEKAIKAHDKAFQVTSGNFLLRHAVAPWHLWVVPSDGGKARRLTQGTFSLDTDQGGATRPAWSSDGTHIAFTKFPSAYWGPSFHSVIAEVDVNGGKPHTLVRAEGANSFAYAPKGRAFAFLRARGGDQNNGNAVYVHANGTTYDATRALARNFNAFAWMAHGRNLLLAGELGTHSVLWMQPLHGPGHRIALGDVEARPDIDVSKTGLIAFVGSTATHPGELYVLGSTDARPRRLTDVNGFVDKLELGHSETVTWKGPDGFHEDGVLTYPVAYTKGRRYPLVLVIHGGPEGASTVRFSALPQLLATAGFLVFEPNYRGSTNLGDAYQHAIYRDTGDGPGKDVMAGLGAVEDLGVVNRERIGVSGWSYGGYMTAWLTGHATVWKAAVCGAALTDWVMDYTISYYQRGDTYFFGGSPWSAKYWEIWRAQSPIQYARNVTAPTLIMGDVGDPNVPLVNSYEWYHALRDNGVTVTFYAYPENTHFPHDIVQVTDVYRRWVNWMKKYLR
ncbi:MAG: S9 family peptidase [Acidobacteria bacterium]|nr:S9 family peptidase [Acidobacteriota bacterium]